MADEINTLDWQETYKSLITIATEGFKYLALANGGAAVAILAYLGKTAENGCSPPDMRLAMGAFLAGLFLCGCAMVSAYKMQFWRLNQLSKKMNTIAGWRLNLTLGLSVLSLLAFGCGSWLGVAALVKKAAGA